MLALTELKLKAKIPEEYKLYYKRSQMTTIRHERLSHGQCPDCGGTPKHKPGQTPVLTECLDCGTKFMHYTGIFERRPRKTS